uniref:Glycosyltransferase family 92 protein n=1 Tax=Diabrotica virgifera virgifera TaxID=50390 RepID=A0A6P7GHY1_DIAVI
MACPYLYRTRFYIAYVAKSFLVCIMTIIIFFFVRHILYSRGILLKIKMSKHHAESQIKAFSSVLETDIDAYSDEKALSDEQLKLAIEKILPSLPKIKKDWKSDAKRGYNQTCANFFYRFVLPLNIEYRNSYWQSQKTSNGTFLLYNAYLDTRSENTLGPTVRIVGMIDIHKINSTTYCHLWFNGTNNPVIVKTFEHRSIWWFGKPQKGYFIPYLISCVLPKKFSKRIPESISLVERECDNATNRLRVLYDNPGKKEDFAVCVKGLTYPNDISSRLSEWIEMLNATGVNKIFFYELYTHPNIRKILNYYEKIGKIQVTSLTLPAGASNVPFLQHFYLEKQGIRKRLNEIVPYNDCFYRNMYRYKYIIVIDTDEVIVPMKDDNLKALMHRVKMKLIAKGKIERGSAYTVTNVHFVNRLTQDKTIPKHMYMLRHTYREKKMHTKEFLKSFVNTEKVLTLFNHYPLGCLKPGPCLKYHIDSEDAHLQHYRENCKIKCKGEQQSIVTDESIWKYRDILIKRVKDTLNNTGLIKK